MPKYIARETVLIIKQPPKPAYAEPLLFLSTPAQGGGWAECLDKDGKHLQVPMAVLENVYKACPAEQAAELRHKHWEQVAIHLDATTAKPAPVEAKAPVTAEKPAEKKSAPAKADKKPAAKKTSDKKPAEKASAKKSEAKKAPAKKAPAAKTASKATTKKPAAKKAPAKKAR